MAGTIRDGGQDQGQAARQLQGTWVLTSFQPEVKFEPMLVGLLDAQIGTLVISFDGKTITAAGPGIDVTRNYEVVKSLFDHVEIVIFGEDGSSYEMAGDFVGDELRFESRSNPWKGKGQLQRQ